MQSPTSQTKPQMAESSTRQIAIAVLFMVLLSALIIYGILKVRENRQRYEFSSERPGMGMLTNTGQALPNQGVIIKAPATGDRHIADFESEFSFNLVAPQ